jgi:hypothetical protein
MDIPKLLGYAIGTEGEGRNAKHGYRQIQPSHTIPGRDPYRENEQERTDRQQKRRNDRLPEPQRASRGSDGHAGNGQSPRNPLVGR